MTVRVGELVSQLRTKSRVVNAKLGNVRLVVGDSDNPTYLSVGDERFPWGDRNTQVVAGFVKGPGYKYYGREPLDWQAQVLRHHIAKNADADTVWYVEGNSIFGIYHPDDKIIPLDAVAEVVSNVFGPDDLANVLYGTDQVEINVLSKVKTVTVPSSGRDSTPRMAPWRTPTFLVARLVTSRPVACASSSSPASPSVLRSWRSSGSAWSAPTA